MTNTIIIAGAGLNIQDKNGSTPLHFGNRLEKLCFSIKYKIK